MDKTMTTSKSTISFPISGFKLILLSKGLKAILLCSVAVDGLLSIPTRSLSSADTINKPTISHRIVHLSFNVSLIIVNLDDP